VVNRLSTVFVGRRAIAVFLVHKFSASRRKEEARGRGDERTSVSDGSKKQRPGLREQPPSPHLIVGIGSRGLQEASQDIFLSKVPSGSEREVTSGAVTFAENFVQIVNPAMKEWKSH